MIVFGLLNCAGSPVFRVGSPFFQAPEVFFVDKIPFNRRFEKNAVVRKRFHAAFCFFECLHRLIESISKDRNKPFYNASFLPESLNGFQAAASRADEVFDHHYGLALLKMSFYHIGEAMLFGFTANINERQIHLLRYQRADSDAAGSYACDHIRFSIRFSDNLHKVLPDIVTDLGVGKYLPVIAVDRRFDATCPCERLLRLKLHSFYLKEKFSNFNCVIIKRGHGAKVNFVFQYAVVFMNKRIYYKDKYIGFTGHPGQLAQNQFIEMLGPGELKTKALNELLDSFLGSEKGKSYLLVGQDFKKVIEKLKPRFQYIEAAGGFIENEGRFLFIFRHGRWDLPKGKREKNETVEECAIRECEEECGVKGLKIRSKLQSTWHIYEHKGGFALKKAYWFHMTTDYTGRLTPQVQEDITEVKWMTGNEAEKVVLENTYYTIADVLSEVLDH